MNPNRIYLASDHAGFKLKNNMLRFLIDRGYNVTDCGPYDFNESDDYPDYVASVASEVSQNPDDAFGIIIGGSGQGEAIMANRFPNVRAVVYQGGNSLPTEGMGHDRVAITREHNNANIFSLGAWFMTEEEAKSSVLHWLKTPFSGEERHVRRLRKVESLSPRGVKGGESTQNVEL